MKSRAFIPAAVDITVVLNCRRELGLPLFLLTGHLSPLESTIDVPRISLPSFIFAEIGRGNPTIPQFSLSTNVVLFQSGLLWAANQVINI